MDKSYDCIYAIIDTVDRKDFGNKILEVFIFWLELLVGKLMACLLLFLKNIKWIEIV